MLEFLKMAQKRSAASGSAGSGQKKAAQRPQYGKYPPQPVGAPEVVDPIWILKAIGVMLVVSLMCGYASLCFLLYHGQWQLILHPKQMTSAPATIAGQPVETVKFGTDESGTPQITGWLIPAAAGAKYAAITVLYLPSGDGSLVDAEATLGLLHSLGVQVLGFDYRGYGQSAEGHPSQAKMEQDAEWAFGYLKNSRAIPEHAIVPYGVGVGGSLALHLAATHAEIPAVIVDTPGPDPLTLVLADPRTKSLPVRLLMQERFPLAEPLAALKTPKLLITPEVKDARLAGAADPKATIFSMPVPTSAEYGPKATMWLGRFLDEYVGGGAR